MADKPMPPDIDLPIDYDTPLPLLVAKRWDFPLAFVETDDGLYYSVQDWLRGLTGEIDVRRNWVKFKTKQNIEYKNFAYKAANKKTYHTAYVKEREAIRILTMLRIMVGRKQIIAIRNFIADYDYEYEYLRLNFKLSVPDDHLEEREFQRNLVNILYKTFNYKVSEFYHLPSGKIIDITLMELDKNNEEIIQLAIECKVKEADFYKAVGQLACYSAEINQRDFQFLSTQTVLAMPSDCINDYMQNVIQWLNMKLWTLIDDVVVDVITNQPVTGIDMERSAKNRTGCGGVCRGTSPHDQSAPENRPSDG